MNPADLIALISSSIYLIVFIPTMAWLFAHYRQKPACPRQAGEGRRWPLVDCVGEQPATA
jgi:hypothetical protein